jgi:hypothetical protein
MPTTVSSCFVGQGTCLFDEFANWAITKHLEMEGFNDADMVDLKVQHTSTSADYLKEYAKKQKRKQIPTEAPDMPKLDSKIWTELVEKLPINKTKEHRARRKKMFHVSIASRHPRCHI